MLTIFSTFEASGQPLLRTGEIELRGTLGTALRQHEPDRDHPRARRRVPGPQAAHASRSCLSNKDGYGELDTAHARNFLDCVKSRQRPNCDVEEGHRSTSYALLANIALATKIAARLGRPGRAIHQQRRRQRAARLRISPAVVACVNQRGLRHFSGAPPAPRSYSRRRNARSAARRDVREFRTQAPLRSSCGQQTISNRDLVRLCAWIQTT